MKEKIVRLTNDEIETLLIHLQARRSEFKDYITDTALQSDVNRVGECYKVIENINNLERKLL